MDEAIRNLCLALKGEADTVIGCIDRLASLPDGSNKAAQTLDMIRLDGVAHIQSLTLARKDTRTEPQTWLSPMYPKKRKP